MIKKKLVPRDEGGALSFGRRPPKIVSRQHYSTALSIRRYQNPQLKKTGRKVLYPKIATHKYFEIYVYIYMYGSQTTRGRTGGGGAQAMSIRTQRRVKRGIVRGALTCVGRDRKCPRRGVSCRCSSEARQHLRCTPR